MVSLNTNSHQTGKQASLGSVRRFHKNCSPNSKITEVLVSHKTAASFVKEFLAINTTDEARVDGHPIILFIMSWSDRRRANLNVSVTTVE
jgi:hypothetical protein